MCDCMYADNTTIETRQPDSIQTLAATKGQINLVKNWLTANKPELNN